MVKRITSALFIAVVLFVPFGASAAAPTVQTFMSKIYTGDGGSALLAYLDMPKGMAPLGDGSFLIADTVNNALRRITADGIISTYSGTGDFGNKNGTIAKATWGGPEGIAVDTDGTIYVAEGENSDIRKISNGTVTTLSIKKLKSPHAVIIDGDTLYISDTGNKRVVSVPKTGGTVTVLGAVEKPMKIAKIGSTLYVADNVGDKLVAIDIAAKSVSTVATGLIEARAVLAYNGMVYVSAGASGIWNEIWQVDPATGVTTMIFRQREDDWLNQTSDLFEQNINGTPHFYLLEAGGSSVYTVMTDGTDLEHIVGVHRYEDEMGAKASALVGKAVALALSPDKTKLYMSYANGNKLAVYDTATGLVSFLAGHVRDSYREGVGDASRFSAVSSMAVSPNGKTLYVVDQNSERIRSVDIATQTTSYLTGAGITDLIDPNDPTGVINTELSNGYAEGGPCPTTFTWNVAGCAYFNRPSGLALTKDGKTLYIADAGNNRIRKVTIATGRTSLIAGSTQGFKDGKGSKAKFFAPYQLALSKDEKTLYVVEKSNHAVRKIDLKTKAVTTLAGNGKAGYRDGAFKVTRFSVPQYITVGPAGNLYVSDVGGQRIRKMDLKKKITTTVAGTGERGFKNGTPSRAKFNNPKALLFWNGTIIVTDGKNDLIRSITVAGIKATALPKVKITKKIDR